MKNWVCLCVLVGCLQACQTPMQSGSQCVLEEGALASMNTYVWRNDPPIKLSDPTGYVSPIVLEQLQRAVEGELQKKGFEIGLDDASADSDVGLELDVLLRTRRELVSIMNPNAVCQTIDCRDNIDAHAEARMDMRTVGFLAADVYLDGKPIWRGWVETNLHPKDRDRAGEVIARAIPKLLETFPP